MGKFHRILGLHGTSLLLSLPVPGACEAGQPSALGSPLIATVPQTRAPLENPRESRMWMSVGEQRFAITLADSEAARAFAALLPLTLDMEELNGNEKYGQLPKALPTNASRPGTIRNGDLLLYGSDTLVVFYATFSSNYAYTRIGRVDDPAGLAAALGSKGVRVAFASQ
ncbi:cyclophilin-like fold protein [Piscinibacter sp.]|uniref:cyclophilin-like fold protein n=1 Tax=Piscinibacter sp. TaxID=1903157 RepID=UPI0039E2F73B